MRSRHLACILKRLSMAIQPKMIQQGWTGIRSSPAELWRVVIPLLLLATACTNAGPGLPPVTELTYEQDMTLHAPSPTSNCVISVLPASPGPELSYQEDLGIHPPPPCNLKATKTANGIDLQWDLPPKVPVPHQYSDKVLFYKIYRRTETTGFCISSRNR